MDCPIAAQYQPRLACCSVPNQHRLLQYLALLVAPQYTAATLAAVVSTLNALCRPLTAARHRVLTEDLTQTTAQAMVACITAAQASGLAPSTINTTLGLLTAFFASLRDEGQMTPQPVRRRPRLLMPTVLPQPLPDPALAAFFQVIAAVRDRLMFLFMLRCGFRVSEGGALAWDALALAAGTVRMNRGKGQVDRLVSLSPEVEQTLQVEVERIQREPLSDRELQKAKNQIESEFLFAQDSVHMLANLLGRYETVASWKLLDGFVDGVRKVTAADVQRVARQYLTQDNRTVAILIPVKPGDAAAGAGK